MGNPQISRYHCCGFQVSWSWAHAVDTKSCTTLVESLEIVGCLPPINWWLGFLPQYHTVLSKKVPHIKPWGDEKSSGWWFGNVWNMAFLTFHILGIVTPTDELIFFRWVGQPPTSLCKIAWSLCCFVVYISVPIPRAEMLIGILIGWYWIILDVI